MTDPRHTPFLDAAPHPDELHDFWDAKPQRPVQCLICEAISAAMPVIVTLGILACVGIWVTAFKWVL